MMPIADTSGSWRPRLNSCDTGEPLGDVVDPRFTFMMLDGDLRSDEAAMDSACIIFVVPKAELVPHSVTGVWQASEDNGEVRDRGREAFDVLCRAAPPVADRSWLDAGRTRGKRNP